MLPNGTAVLAYPPSMHRVESDSDAVSVATLSRVGRYLMYLNATPRQGAETLRNWAALRLHSLRSDDASAAREVTSATGLRFRGGVGSCVVDIYRTRIGGHDFTELACLVRGRAGASVVVTAAPTARWAADRGLLLRAVAAYRAR